MQLTTGEFEIDTKRGSVECVQCVQLWKSSSAKESRSCGPQAPTCRGNACFMRQCKHCPVYQYMSGCLNLDEWQMSQLEINRRYLELRMTRFGAILLCEDSFNQTTCVCNRRDRCNSIHSRAPYTTVAEGLFHNVVDFESVIGEIDPRYLEVMSGYRFRFNPNGSTTSFCSYRLVFMIYFLYILLRHFNQ